MISEPENIKAERLHVVKNSFDENWSTYLLAILCIVAAMFMVSSCTSSQKAAWILEKKGKLAEVCATKYPAQAIGIDSTDYLDGIKFLQMLVDEVEKNDKLSAAERDKILAEIERLKNKPLPVPGPCDCDTITGILRRLASIESKRAADLLTKYKEVVKASLKIKPVIKEVENTAKVKALEADMLKCSGEKNTLLIKLNEYKTKARKRWWALFGTGVAGLALLGFGLYKRVKKGV